MSGKWYKNNNKIVRSHVRPAIILISIVMLLAVSANVISRENKKNRTDIIDFGDMQSSMELALGDKFITEDEANRVKILDFSEAPINIQDFECLSYFKNLESIIMEDSTIRSFKGINKFTNLTEIKIENSRIDDISDIRDLQVAHLSIIRCGVSGVIDFGEMPQLLELNLSDNYIWSVRGRFPMLTVFNVENNEIETIKSLDIPTTTEELNISGNPISKLDGIEKYDNINKLKVYQTNIANFSPLKDMDSLNALYIDKDDMSEDLEYLYDNFRNGDNSRKVEYLERYFHIEQ